MGLKFIGSTDLAAFLNAIQASQSLGREFLFTNEGVDSSKFMPIGTYIHDIDKYLHKGHSAGGVPGPVGDVPAWIGMPPLIASPGFPDTFVEQLVTFDHNTPKIPGDPRRPGGQKVYTHGVGGILASTAPIETVDPLLALEPDGAFAFPTVVPADGPVATWMGKGAFTPHSVPGGWNGGPVFAQETGTQRIIFEGLTDGIPGETNLVGANVYPAGLMLARCEFATCPAPIGTGVANDCNNAVIWIDLNTGGVAGRMINTAGIVSATLPNAEAPIAGKEFSWYTAQYVPDDDATFGVPKGEFHFYSDRHSIGVNPSFQESVFLKVIDFNPLGVAPTGGAPNRVHERVRLGPTTVDFDISPMFGVGGAGDNINSNMQLAYHPLSQRFFMVQADIPANVTSPGPAPGGESFIGYWLRTVDPVGVTSPVARDVPRTNDIVEYEGFVGGALGEPAAGVDVDWELFRNSTELEVIVPVFPGFNTVVNFPIDENFAGDPEGSLLVFADSVLLVEGVDYTVTLASGRITWITDQTGATLVEATYEHRTVDASPPHGTLLSSASQSEIDGRVFTQVLWPDDNDLVGKLDRLKVDLA